MKVIDFTTGGLDHHPVANDIVREALADCSPSLLLGYHDPAGVEVAVKERIRQLWHLPDGEIVLTSSGTEALFLAFTRTPFLAIQEPSYFGVWRAAKMLRVPHVPWEGAPPMNAVVYLCPDHHPAFGQSISIEQRKELATRHTCYIEDTPYYPLHFATDPLPHICSLRDEPKDMVVGCFAKLLGPGVRCGFIWTRDAGLAKSLRSAKITVDLGQSFLLLQIIARAATPENVNRIRAHNLQCKRVAEGALGQSLAVDGGAFLRLRGDKEQVERLGVRVDDFSHHYSEPAKASGIRLNFLRNSQADLHEGLSRIRGLVETYT